MALAYRYRLVRLAVALSVTVCIAVVRPGSVSAVQVVCGFQQDGLGWTLDAGRDFDGDGMADIAVGAPCARANGQFQAGKAFVYSGTDGSKLLVIRGTAESQHLGASVAFVGDLTGDGLPDLAVGSPGWPVEVPGIGMNSGAGKVEVYGGNGDPVLLIEGVSSEGHLGETLVGFGDVNGDGAGEILAGEPDGRVAGEKRGNVYVLSGLDGSVMDVSQGRTRFDRWGSVLGAIDDVDGDSIPDALVASAVADFQGQENTGIVDLLSGASLATVLTSVHGAPNDKLGRGLAAAGDLDGDGLADFLAGSPGADPNNSSRAGTVTLYSSTGSVLLTASEPIVQSGAAFGTTIASPADVNGDGRADFAASAPVARVSGISNAGRVQMLSGADASVLWSRAGTLPQERIGQALASGADWNGDGVPDLVVGAPGAAPKGRRGAGTVHVLSGSDGSQILELNGRHGLETRIFIAGWRRERVVTVRSTRATGRRAELRKNVFRRLRHGSLSLAVLDAVSSPAPGRMRIVVGAGRGGDDDTVRVLRAGRRGTVVSSFVAFGQGYSGGVNVATGNMLGDSQDEIVAAQADATFGNVVVKVFERFDTDPLGRISWIESDAFSVFQIGEIISSQPVDATGAMVAAGELEPGNEAEEFVVGSVAGTPVVRVFDGNGTALAEWVAYLPDQGAGTYVATGDLDGDGVDEIVTAPVTGRPWVKAFTGDGTPFVPDGANTPVSFFAFDLGFRGGVRVAVADVDLDGKGEILVAPGPGMTGRVTAFEADGTIVEGWNNFFPLGPGSKAGLTLAATDLFLRR